jgi:LuxR family maltose regulon positive regulatory protein
VNTASQTSAEGISFAALLKRYRVEAGLSQEALAERANMSTRGVSDLERGLRRAPYRDTVAQLATALELDDQARAALERAARRLRDSAPREGQSQEPAPTVTPTDGTVLLATKLAAPTPRAALVPRQHLLERLEAGLTVPLTLIAAPAGSGKTTLLAAWRAGLLDRNISVAWLSLDAGDNDPNRFWRYVLAGLKSVRAAIDIEALTSLLTVRSIDVEAMLTPLINALMAVPGETVLILEDYHLITSRAVHDGVAFLLEHLPPHVHLVITTRVDPPLHLGRLRARGLIIELRAADLRFSPEETAVFLTEVMNLPLGTENAQALQTRTEGWIAGLQLAALSLQGRPPEAIEQFIASFTGSHRHVVDYLADEVVTRLSEPVQVFLLYTSVLDRLCAPLCAFLMDGEETIAALRASQELLEELERSNLFLVALDDESRWYRYHHLFADMLRHRLTQTQHHRVVELHARATDWFEREGSLEEAIGHALSAGDHDRAAALIEPIAWVVYDRGAIETLRVWIDALPDAVLRGWPRLCIVRAWLLVGRDAMTRVESYLQAAEDALHRTPPAVDRRSIEGDIAAVRSYTAVSYDDPSVVLVQGAIALDRLDEGNVFLRGLVAVAMGSAYLHQGDLSRSIRTLSDAVARGRAVGSATLAISLAGQQSFAQRVQGALHLAAATCEEALEWNAQRDHPSPYVASPHASLADLFREWNELDRARPHLSEALRVVPRWSGGGMDFTMFCLLVQARILAAEGDVAGALEVVHEARRRVRAPQAIWMLDTLEAFEVQLWLAQGNLPPAVNWLQRQAPEAYAARLRPSTVFYVGVHEHVVVAPVQVLLAQGRDSGDPAPLHRALTLLERQRAEAERVGLAWCHIKALALQALTYHALGEETRARGALEEALVLAQPEGYVRVFADEGEPMADLLRQIEAPVIRSEYLQSLVCWASPSSAIGQSEPPPGTLRI